MLTTTNNGIFSNYGSNASSLPEQQSNVFSSNEKIKEFLNNIPDMVLMLNSKRETVFVNNNMKEFINQDESAFTGRKIGDIFSCINAEKSPGGCGTSEKCRQCGAFLALEDAKRSIKASYEYTLSRAGKEDSIFQVWTVPLFINGESFIKFIMRDIGDVKQKQQLENVFMKDLSLLTNGLLHKLEYAKQNPYSRDNVFDEVYFISNEIHDLIQSQQDLIAAEEDRLQPQITDTNSYCELQSIIRDLKLDLQKTQKSIILKEDSDKVFFQCDKRLLKQILRHMLNNALEATQAGESVQAECIKKDDKVLFKIHNNACIPEEVQKQLFRRAFSTKGKNRGMGTYSMKLFAEKYMNGEITCSSSPKHGTTFIVSLPLIKI